MPATQNLHNPSLMAEKPLKSPQRSPSELGTPPPQKPPNPTGKYSQFLLKASFFAIAIAVLPFLPSQAPDFINKTLITRTWELLRLIIVGIAVCYGLLCRRYSETEKENQVPSQIDTTQNYVSKILQVSSVFDEELETLTASNDNGKVQTWNSQYFPGESVVTKVNGVHSNSSNRPLFLPVRSLKSSLSDTAQASEIEDSNTSVLEEKSKGETVVLPSPIPWRSRSGRMEVKEEQLGLGLGFPSQYSFPTSVKEAEIHSEIEGLPFRSPIPWSSRPASSSSRSPKLSPSASLSPEQREKDVEDSGKKKSFHRSSDEFLSAGFRSESFPEKRERKISGDEEEFGRSFRSESFREKRERKISREEEEFGRSFNSESFPEKKERGISGEEEEFARGFRSESEKKERKINRDDEFTRSFRSESFSEKKDKNITGNGSRRISPNPEDQPGSSPIGKSVRTIRSSENRGDPLAQERRNSPENDDRKKTREPEFEKPGKRTPGYYSNEKSSREIPLPPPLPDFSGDYKKKTKKREVAEKIKVRVEEGEKSSEVMGDGNENNNGDNEVDKKADEFIAKFREQIRLQRIESIKKLSGQHAKNQS